MNTAHLKDIKLHIGGTDPRPGWSILDVVPGPHVNFLGNCKDLSFLPDGSCAEVYACHVLEHLGYNDDLPLTLKGIHRVLKPGGRLRVSVPDLEVLCELFLRPELARKDRFYVMRMMFGGRTDEYDVHLSGLSSEFLANFLETAGFRDVARVEIFGEFEDLNDFRFHGELISLNMEAFK